MSEDNGESFMDKVKGAIEGATGGESDINTEDPTNLADQLNLDPNERRDAGLGLRDVDSNPYAGSAGSQAMELAEGIQPGTKSGASEYRPVDSALSPLDDDS